MLKTVIFTLIFAFTFLPKSSATPQKNKTAQACPPGKHWVKAHQQRAYIRDDGTPVSSSYHKAGCRKNPESYATWNNRLKAGFPPKWEFKSEKSKNWTQDEKENVLDALSTLPSILLNENVPGIYRLKTSAQLAENPAANFQKQIALYDKAFSGKYDVARILAHELSHVFYQKMTTAEQVDYAKAAKWKATLWAGLRDIELTLNRKDFIEEDSQNNPEEDFTNNIEYFLFDSQTLKKKNPQLYDWISKKFGDKLKLRNVK